MTGKVKWVAEDATTAYNTPVFGKRADGVQAIPQFRVDLGRERRHLGHDHSDFIVPL